MRCFLRVCLGLVLSLVSTACAPTFVGPTVPSGYFFALHVSDPSIWQESSNPPPSVRVPTSAVLTVHVRDAQGQPVDGVPVQFQVEPAWMRDVSLSPPQATTQAGKAQAVFRGYATGVVRIQAHVDNTTQEARIAVQPPYALRDPGGN